MDGLWWREDQSNDLLHFLQIFGLVAMRACSHRSVHVHRARPRHGNLDPMFSFEPWCPHDLGTRNLAWVRYLVGPEPIFDAVVDPPMQAPEDGINVRRILFAEMIVRRIVPLWSDIPIGAAIRNELLRRWVMRSRDRKSV